MGPADADTYTDTDICSWLIFLLIPKPIYLDRDNGHQYLHHQYFSKANTSRYFLISKLCNQYIADNDIADIHLTNTDTDKPIPITIYRYRQNILAN